MRFFGEEAMKCNNCGQSLKRLMLLALLEDAGAKVYPSSTHCRRGVEHNFEDQPENELVRYDGQFGMGA